MNDKPNLLTIRAPQSGSYPMTATWSHVAQDMRVRKGDPLLDLMAHNGKEIRVRAPKTGRVVSPPHSKGASVLAGMVLVVLEPSAIAGEEETQAGAPDADEINAGPAAPAPQTGPVGQDVPTEKKFRAASPITPAPTAPKAPRSPAGEATLTHEEAPARQPKRGRRAVPLAVYGLLALAIWGGMGGIRLPVTEQVTELARDVFETPEQQAYRECQEDRERQLAEQKERREAAAAEGKASFEFPIAGCEGDDKADSYFQFVRSGETEKAPEAPPSSPSPDNDPLAPPPATSGSDFDAAQRNLMTALSGTWVGRDGVFTYNSALSALEVNTESGLGYVHVYPDYSSDLGWHFQSLPGEVPLTAEIYEMRGPILVLYFGGDFIFLYKE